MRIHCESLIVSLALFTSAIKALQNIYFAIKVNFPNALQPDAHMTIGYYDTWPDDISLLSGAYTICETFDRATGGSMSANGDYDPRRNPGGNSCIYSGKIETVIGDVRNALTGLTKGSASLNTRMVSPHVNMGSVTGKSYCPLNFDFDLSSVYYNINSKGRKTIHCPQQKREDSRSLEHSQVSQKQRTISSKVGSSSRDSNRRPRARPKMNQESLTRRNLTVRFKSPVKKELKKKKTRTFSGRPQTRSGGAERLKSVHSSTNELHRFPSKTTDRRKPSPRDAKLKEFGSRRKSAKVSPSSSSSWSGSRSISVSGSTSESEDYSSTHFKVLKRYDQTIKKKKRDRRRDRKSSKRSSGRWK